MSCPSRDYTACPCRHDCDKPFVLSLSMRECHLKYASPHCKQKIRNLLHEGFKLCTAQPRHELLQLVSARYEHTIGNYKAEELDAPAQFVVTRRSDTSDSKDARLQTFL